MTDAPLSQRLNELRMGFMILTRLPVGEIRGAVPSIGASSWTWPVVGAAIGALTGILVSPLTLTSYDVGTMLALKGFAAAMLGGMGNPIGAVAGGLILGLLEALGVGYISSTYKDAFAFIVILLVLFAMPQGLFGRRAVERV